MKTFCYNYKIVDTQGSVQKGQLFASSQEEARKKIATQAKIILLLKKNPLYLDFTSDLFAPKISKEDIINFTRQLHILFAAGISLVDSLIIIRTFTKNKGFYRILDSLVSSIESGEKFSQSLAHHSKLFSSDYIALVKAGEISGTLNAILLDIHQIMVWEKGLKKRIKGALRYPVIVISFAFIALLGMFNFVIPKFAKIFMQAKTPLPLPTKILLSFSNFFTAYGLWLLALIVILVMAVYFAYKKPKFKEFVDYMMLKIPLTGNIYQKYLITRFCNIFSILYQKGVAIIPALTIAKQLNSNAIYQKDIDLLIYRTQRGSSLGAAAGETVLLNGTVSQMATIGEKSSALGVMLEKVSELYSDELNNMLDNIFTYIEPLFIIIIGLLVLTLAFGIFLPMWNMTSVLTS
jgi:type IV pilus assembly protein PilC